MSDCLQVAMVLKDDWRFVVVAPGEQFVMISFPMLMHKLHVISSAFQALVSWFIAIPRISHHSN